MTDNIDVGKRRVDRSRDVTMNVGEYEVAKIQDILMLPEGMYKITIEPYDDDKSDS